MRKWIFICIIVVVFIFGNFVLYKSADRKLKDVKKHRHNVGQILTKVEDVEPTVDYTAERDRPTHKHAETDAARIMSLPETTENGKKVTGNFDFKYKIGILVIACNRPSVSRCLDQIFKIRPKSVQMPVIVSQDCGHSETEAVIKSYGDKLTLFKQPDLSDVPGVPSHMSHFMGYYKISRHYKFALDKAFRDPKIDSVIVIEDDLNIGNFLSFQTVNSFCLEMY